MTTRLAYFLAFLGILIGVFASVRVGALAIASGLIVFLTPDFRQMRTIEKVISAARVVSLITIALALPRR